MMNRDNPVVRSIDARDVAVLQSKQAEQEALGPAVHQYGILSPAAQDSPVYQATAALLRLPAVGDPGHPDNPLGKQLSAGQTVVIKPNLVFHEHYRGGLLHGVVTDPRIIRAVADFVFRAIGPEGRLVIGDAPLQSANWELLCERTGLGGLPDYYARQGLRCDLRDFRTLATQRQGGLKMQPRKLAGDPAGYRAVDLGPDSLHQGGNWQRFRVTNYDPEAMQSHHNGERHEYLLAASILSADVVINLSKLKTHRKSGLTGPLKNLVGINGCKDWLPHHTKGSAASGGDEYRAGAAWKSLSTWLVEREEGTASEALKRSLHGLRRSIWFAGKQMAADLTWEGSWTGNDTLWRTILDLNRAALYADAQGRLQPEPQRRFLALVDAVLAGQGEGPMAPAPAPRGLLLGGWCPAAVERSAVKAAGWPVEALPAAANSFRPFRFPLAAFDAAGIREQRFEMMPDGSVKGAGAWPDREPLAPSSGWAGIPSPEVSPERVHV
jgi:uncharacterized protein (DUF362 family)